MKETIAFLEELREHNCKQWFDDNRSRYKRLRSRFEELVGELIDGISLFDPEVRGLGVKDCTYRINRDIRFSADKSPYKTYFSAFIAPCGKKSGYAGYYIHIEPRGEGLLGGSVLAAGQVCIPPVVLRSIREEILDNGEQMFESIRSAEGFSIDETNKLKRTPTGFPSGTPYDELLKLKDVCLIRPLEDELLYDSELLPKTLAMFRTTQPFLAQLNRAVRYAYEEMM